MTLGFISITQYTDNGFWVRVLWTFNRADEQCMLILNGWISQLLTVVLIFS